MASRGAGTNPPTERQIHRSILGMVKLCFPRCFSFHIPNGAHLAGNAAARFKQIGALKGDGLRNGMPDIGILWPVGKGAWIEVKRPKTGKLSDEQKSIHELLHALGWPVRVVTSTEDAYLFLRELGAPWNGVVWGDVF